MNYLDWLSIALICFIGAATPGPSLLIISYQATTFTYKHGILCSIAHGFGIFIYAIITAFGIGYLIIKYPSFYYSLKILGIIFLFYLSIKMLLYRELKFKRKISKSSFQSPILLGFLTSILNPKIILFFISIFSQFIDYNISFSEKLMISILASLIDTTWYILFVLLIKHSLTDIIVENKVFIIKFMGFFLTVITFVLIINLGYQL